VYDDIDDSSLEHDVLLRRLGKTASCVAGP
jgi:hypothetical protein